MSVIITDTKSSSHKLTSSSDPSARFSLTINLKPHLSCVNQ